MPNTKGNLTRRHIIEQALQLFTVKGYFNTSINDILQATGLTKGGLYGHFGSKEDIWFAVYDVAVVTWRGIVLAGSRDIADPLERIEVTIEKNLRDYLGGEVFDGGCFFFNMLVELSGQSTRMSQHILRGFVRFSKLMQQWLAEAREQGQVPPDLDVRQVADFIVIALNGAAPLYAASRDPGIWQLTIDQLHHYIRHLGRQGVP